MKRIIPSFSTLRDAVSTAVGMTHEEWMHTRLKFRVSTRRVFMLLLSRTGRSLTDIGRAMGGMHHTTIMHGLNVATEDELALASSIWEGLKRDRENQRRREKNGVPT